MMCHGRLVLAVFSIFVHGVQSKTIEAVRLVDGPNKYKGRIEYTRHVNGIWHAVCGDELGSGEVSVICNELGYPGANRAIMHSPYGEFNATPTTYIECDPRILNVTYCHILDISDCTSVGAAACYDNDYLGCFITNDLNGILSGTYRRDPENTIERCIAFCRSSVEYVYAGVREGDICLCGTMDSTYDRGGAVFDDECDVVCAGRNTESCGGSNRVAVFLIPPVTTAAPTTSPKPTSTSPPPTSNPTSNPTSRLEAISLQGGSNRFEGRITFTRFGTFWNSTCGDNLGINDVIVICKQLGFSGANRALQDSPFDDNTVAPMNYLECNGDETNVAECELQTILNCTTVGAAICYDDSYLGCYVDDDGINILTGSFRRDAANTLERCMDFCRNSKQYVYAGLKFGDQCVCGDIDSDYSRLGRVSDAECQTSCPSGNDGSCGGIERLSVFLIKPDLTQVPSASNAGTIAGLSVLIGLLLIYGIVFTTLYVRTRKSLNEPPPKSTDSTTVPPQNRYERPSVGTVPNPMPPPADDYMELQETKTPDTGAEEVYHEIPSSKEAGSANTSEENVYVNQRLVTQQESR